MDRDLGEGVRQPKLVIKTIRQNARVYTYGYPTPPCQQNADNKPTLTCLRGRRGRADPGPSCCTTARRKGPRVCLSTYRRSRGSGCCPRCTPGQRHRRCPRRPRRYTNPHLKKKQNQERKKQKQRAGRQAGRQTQHNTTHTHTHTPHREETASDGSLIGEITRTCNDPSPPRNRTVIGENRQQVTEWKQNEQMAIWESKQNAQITPPRATRLSQRQNTRRSYAEAAAVCVTVFIRVGSVRFGSVDPRGLTKLPVYDIIRT